MEWIRIRYGVGCVNIRGAMNSYTIESDKARMQTMFSSNTPLLKHKMDQVGEDKSAVPYILQL